VDVDPEATPQALMPDCPTLSALSKAAASCRGCDLWRDATQTVFGQGSARAAVLLVGEQPGDREDRQGAPFVGPAGRVPDDALAAAGIDRNAVFVTNTAKHFRWQPKGKRRRLVTKEMAAFVEDLRKVAAHLAQASNARPSRASS
jgi:DNA polymerase